MQWRIGPRSKETERIYNDFVKNKAELDERRNSLKVALHEGERMNKALKAGRVPSMVIGVLQAIEQAGLGEHFNVVGTHAL